MNSLPGSALTWSRAMRNRIARGVRVARALMEHPATPRASRWLIAAALFYVAIPFDLVPDWIPLLGQLDDVLIVGCLLWLAWRLVPPEVRAQCAVSRPTGA